MIFEAKNDQNLYEYEIKIVAEVSSKEPFKSHVIDECIDSKVELFENDFLETHSLKNIKINKLAFIEPRTYGKIDLITERKIGDVRYWFSSIYTHYIKNLSDRNLKIKVIEMFPNVMIPLLQSFSHRPSRIAKNGKFWILEFEVVLDENQEVYIQLDLEKKMLSFEEYPVDPQRGWDIPSSYISYSDSYTTKIISTESLLIHTPEPDFSMPFNVICITGSVIAFFYTSVQTLLLFKEKTHWSNPNYETQVVKAQKMQNLVKNSLLAVTLIILYILDRKGILKLLG